MLELGRILSSRQPVVEIIPDGRKVETSFEWHLERPFRHLFNHANVQIPDVHCLMFFVNVCFYIHSLSA